MGRATLFILIATPYDILPKANKDNTVVKIHFQTTLKILDVRVGNVLNLFLSTGYRLVTMVNVPSKGLVAVFRNDNEQVVVEEVK
jgi:hypothetical protein